MRLITDEYTGELYDADKMYRGANACWVEKEAERIHREAMAAEKNRRLGVKKSSRRSSERYSEWLRLDGGESFGDFIKRKYGRSSAC